MHICTTTKAIGICKFMLFSKGNKQHACKKQWQTVQPSRFQKTCPLSPTGLCRDTVCPTLQDTLSDCPTVLEQCAY